MGGREACDLAQARRLGKRLDRVVTAAWTLPKRMTQLADENAKLKKLPAEELLEVARLG